MIGWGVCVRDVAPYFFLLVFDEGEVMCHDGRVPWDWSYVAEDYWFTECCGSVYVNSHIVNNENTKTRGYDNYTFIRMLVTCWFFWRCQPIYISCIMCYVFIHMNECDKRTREVVYSDSKACTAQNGRVVAEPSAKHKGGETASTQPRIITS
ncbi:hypothetical protein V8C40DRAFT_9599 [Trichoderma camerunense]